MQEHSVDLPTGALTYFRAGTGRPLLYLHPAGGVRRSPVLAGLAQSFDLVVPVFPGFEGTALHPVNTRKDLAGLIAQFSIQVIERPCDVMGWSFGGCVALWLALERPELVERLVLECPAGLVSIDPKLKRVNRALLEHYGASDGKEPALLERVAQVGHETLILQGDNDGTIPPPSAQLLQSLLRRATLAIIPGAGHDLEVDAPAEVLRLAREFLG